MNLPLVSVVMVVQNVDRFLPESIESILGQTFCDFEFIIVDFGSSDNSKSIISRYAARDARIKFHEIATCTLPLARNSGCALAQGEYIAVMDADDVALPHRLTAEVDFMQKNPEVVLLGGAVEWFDETGRSFGIYTPPSDDAKIRAELVMRCPFWHPTILIRREAFVALGGYRAPFIFAHDYDLELRLADHFKCANLEQVILKYRVHPNQITFHKRLEQTVCRLAARASANLRKNHELDPLDSVQEITAALLARLGISETELQKTLAIDCWNWVRNMTAMGGYAAALDSANQLLSSKLPFVDRWQIAELHLAIARINWKQKKLASSLLAFIRAVVIRPVLVGRPLRKLLTHLQLLSDRRAES
jgi:GT2 family glycosyltransferase